MAEKLLRALRVLEGRILCENRLKCDHNLLLLISWIHYVK